MFIPGFLITWLTFPGVIVHELAHKLFCDLTGTKVIRVCYFRFGNPAGFVIHQTPTSTWKHILIGIGPLFLNSALGFAVGLSVRPFKDTSEATFALLMWLAISIAMHSFPSTGDARSIWSALWREGAPLTAKVVGAPLVGLIYLGAVGSFFWLDLIYGLGIAVGLPELLRA